MLAGELGMSPAAREGEHLVVCRTTSSALLLGSKSILALRSGKKNYMLVRFE